MTEALAIPEPESIVTTIIPLATFPPFNVANLCTFPVDENDFSQNVSFHTSRGTSVKKVKNVIFIRTGNDTFAIYDQYYKDGDGCLLTKFLYRLDK